MTTSSQPATDANSFLSYILPSSAEGVVIVVGMVLLSVYTAWRVKTLHDELTTHETHLKSLSDNGVAMIDAQTVDQQMSTYGHIGRIVTEAWHHLWRVRQLPGLDPQMAVSTVPLLIEKPLGLLRQRPNQLMLLGLLGTVLGLSITIGKFAPQLEQSLEVLSNGESPAALNESLGDLLRQMKVAFICTLWGVALSLLITRLAVLPLIERRDRIQHALEQLVMFRLAPLAWNNLIKRDEAMLAAFQDNRESLEKIHVTMGSQLGIFAQQTDRAAHALRTAGQDLHEIGVKAAEAAHGVTRASGEAARVLKQVSDSLGRSETALEATLVSLGANVSALGAQQHACGEMHAHVLQVTGEHARGLGTLVGSFDEGSTRLLDGLQDNLDSFETARAELVGHTSQLVQAQQEVGHQFNRSATQLFEQVQHLMQEHRGATLEIAAVLRQVEQALAPIDTLTQRLDPRLLPEDRWGNFQHALEALATRWDTWQHTFTQRLDLLLDQNGAAMLTETREQTQEIRRQLGETSLKITEELNLSLHRWNSAYSDLAQHTTGTLQGQMSIANQLQQQHTDLQRDLQRVARSLEGITAHLASPPPSSPDQAQTSGLPTRRATGRESQAYAFTGERLPTDVVTTVKNGNPHQK